MTLLLIPSFCIRNFFPVIPLESGHTSIKPIFLYSGAHLEKLDYTIDENGIPCCPKDPSLPTKHEGSCKLKSGVTRYKLVCPKVVWEKDLSSGKNHRVCKCGNPCTTSICGRMIYTYQEKDLRAYPGTPRGTDECNQVYKTRTYMERLINHIKDCFCLTVRKTRNEKTLHAHLILAGITQLISVVLADKIHKHECIRTLRSLIP